MAARVGLDACVEPDYPRLGPSGAPARLHRDHGEASHTKPDELHAAEAAEDPRTLGGVLEVRDRGGIWAVHQNSGGQRAGFDLLFALLASRPDAPFTLVVTD